MNKETLDAITKLGAEFSDKANEYEFEYVFTAFDDGLTVHGGNAANSDLILLTGLQMVDSYKRVTEESWVSLDAYVELLKTFMKKTLDDEGVIYDDAPMGTD